MVSIIIPTRYSPNVMIKTLKSIRAQTNAPIYVLADYSKPSQRLTKTMSSLDVQYRFIHGQHSYMEKLFLLLELVKTPYVIVTQDDVCWGRSVVENMMRTFSIDDSITMQAAAVLPRSTVHSWVQSGLHFMIRVNDDISTLWNSGDNYLSANGRCLAFATSHIKNARRKLDVLNCDLFLYLENKRLGGRFEKVKSAIVRITPPSKLSDQLGPSSRYQYNRREMSELYHDLDLRMFHIPLLPLLNALWENVLRTPPAAIIYFFIFFYTRVYAFLMQANTRSRQFWEAEATTKV